MYQSFNLSEHILLFPSNLSERTNFMSQQRHQGYAALAHTPVYCQNDKYVSSTTSPVPEMWLQKCLHSSEHSKLMLSQKTLRILSMACYTCSCTRATTKTTRRFHSLISQPEDRLYISADRIFIAKASSSVLFQLLKKVLIVDKDWFPAIGVKNCCDLCVNSR